MAYVYTHTRLDTGEIFYIGISSSKTNYRRAYFKYGRNGIWCSIVKKTSYSVEIIHDKIDYEKAKKIEVDLIAKYGRKNLNKGPLSNLTDGGEGVLGLIPSKETRIKMSESAKGNTSRRGTEVSLSTRRKLSKALKGRKVWNKGVPCSEVERLRLTAIKPAHHSKESKLKISKGNIGKTRNRKKLIDLKSGKIYDSVQGAAKELNIPLRTFYRRLSDVNTKFKYYEQDYFSVD